MWATEWCSKDYNPKYIHEPTQTKINAYIKKQMEERDKYFLQKNSNNVWRYYSLQEEELNSFYSAEGARFCEVGNGKNGRFTVEKPGKCHLNQVMKGNSPVMLCGYFVFPDMMRCTSTVFFQKIHNSSVMVSFMFQLGWAIVQLFNQTLT